MPESKAHLVQASRALTGKQVQFEQVDDDPDSPGLKDGFDWYMSPADKAKYEQIYQENRDMRGEVSCKEPQELELHRFKKQAPGLLTKSPPPPSLF